MDLLHQSEELILALTVFILAAAGFIIYLLHDDAVGVERFVSFHDSTRQNQLVQCVLKFRDWFGIF